MTSQRTLVLGGTGFIGQAFIRRMAEEDVDFLSIGSKDINLESEDAHEKVSHFARQCSSVVFLSAVAPTKTVSDLRRNTLMTESVCKGLINASFTNQLVLVSSDSVYSSRDTFITEATPPAPESLHGLMNLSREIACRHIGVEAFSVIRPTAVFGPLDSHNSYGPNRFARQAKVDGRIVVSGGGMSIRDHIHVDDLANVIWAVLREKDSRIVNAAPGDSVSFRSLAEEMAEEFGVGCEVTFSGQEAAPTARHYVHQDRIMSELVTKFPSRRLRLAQLLRDI